MFTSSSIAKKTKAAACLHANALVSIVNKIKGAFHLQLN